MTKTVWISHRVVKLARLEALYDTYRTTFGVHYPHSNFVPGDGNPHTDVVFIGEAPGADEDRDRRPFVGNSGQLLDRALRAASIRRDQSYVTNLLKYRPPNNRDPRQSEITPMLGFLRMELDIIQPSVVVPLGRFAAQVFFPDAAITQIAGQVYCKPPYLVVPVLHPSYVIRNKTERDWIKSMKEVAACIDAVKRGVINASQRSPGRVEIQSEQRGRGHRPLRRTRR